MGPRVSPLRRIAKLALAVLCVACASTTTTTVSHPQSGCRSGSPEAGVYQPDRLQVLDPCKHAEGLVVDVAAEDDGDQHVWFTPDGGYAQLMNSENHFQGRPAMLAEITPDCQDNPAGSSAAAKCPKSALPIPKLGDHIAIDGPWVLDTNHGWREIHPVDSITIRGSA